MYNTQQEKLKLPAYGRYIQQLIEQVAKIEDREKRTQQAAALLRAMVIVNPSIKNQEGYGRALWDHMQIIADYCLDVDSEYPMPERKELESAPLPVHVEKRPLKARHYGRNIESIIDLIAAQEDGQMKTEMIRSLAIYMRQQYLIWNKDTVADSTILKDLERLSDYRIQVPEGLTLSHLASDHKFHKPKSAQAGNQTFNQPKKRRK